MLKIIINKNIIVDPREETQVINKLVETKYACHLEIHIYGLHMSKRIVF